MPYLQPGSEPPSKGKGSKLSTKMALFVDEYFVDMNASKAVLRAGYKSNNPNRVATELLRHPLVKKAIEDRLNERREKMEFSADFLLTKLMNIINETETSNPQAALRAIELAGKSIALWKERQEISGPDGGAIEMEQRLKEDVNDFTSKLSRLAEQAGAGGVVKFPKSSGDGRA